MLIGDKVEKMEITIATITRECVGNVAQVYTNPTAAAAAD